MIDSSEYIPAISVEEREEIIRDPHSWRLRKLAEMRVAEYMYFITFTWNNSVDKEKWKRRVYFELKRKFVKDIKCIALEHPDSNIHVHAYVEATGKIQHRMFATFQKAYGRIDLKKVRSDNGIVEYFEKENPIKVESLLE